MYRGKQLSVSICNRVGSKVATSGFDSGFSMIEVLIAVFLVMFSVMGFIAIQSRGWLLSAESDFVGRATEILHREIARTEGLIMNPCNQVTPGNFTNTVYSSGQSSPQTGDAAFSVQKTITAAGANLWTVTVQVTWSSNKTGISESITVAAESFAAFPSGCTNNQYTPSFNF